MKLFSTGFKGILEEGSEESLKEIERRMKLKKVGNFAEMMALRYEGVMATDAALLGKASMNLAEQIATSLQVLDVVDAKVTTGELSEGLKKFGIRALQPGENVEIASRKRFNVCFLIRASGFKI